MLTRSGLDDPGIKYSVAERYVSYLSLWAGVCEEKSQFGYASRWLSAQLAKGLRALWGQVLSSEPTENLYSLWYQNMKL